MTAEANFFHEVDSPIGKLLLIGDGTRLHALHMNGDGDYDGLRGKMTRDPDAFAEPVAQLTQYFAGERTDFDLELEAHGTDFQLLVWNALREIPYGETRSYGAVASKVGKPTAARAVGGANNKNPIAVIVPCHRVIGASGALVGYGGGLDRKTWLLDHEAEVARNANSNS